MHRDGNEPTKHRAEYRCAKALAVALYGEGYANDRMATFLNAASGDELGVSNGSIYQFCKMLSKNTGLSIANLEEDC